MVQEPGQLIGVNKLPGKQSCTAACVKCKWQLAEALCMGQVARNTLTPGWHERLGFSDVALGDSITLALFDHKKLTADVFLGQVSLTARQLLCR